MKKIFSIIFLLFTLSLYAEPITEQRAREIAVKFFNGNQTKSASVDVELIWAGNDLSESSSVARPSQLSASLPSIYIFNRVDGKGFVVIAGDDRVRPILAYSKESVFNVENMADGARFILSCWCEQVEAVRSRQGQERFSETPIILALEEEGGLIYETPLWGQGEPFNREAPTMGGERCVTGCLATAMSIISYYNKYPAAGKGTTPEYTCSYNGVTYTIPANELGRTYNYNLMLADYRGGSYTDEQANAVAALMKDMGTAIRMQYSPIESSANYTDALIAFAHNFGYSKTARLEMADSYQYDEWVNILKNNLDLYGPTFYSGQSGSDGSGGHAFVLDGYDNQDYFHINFGWNGNSNGYFYLPNGITYDYYQRAILGLEPDENSESTYTDHVVAYWSSSEYPGIRSDASKYEKGSEFNIYFGGVLNLGMDYFDGQFKIGLYSKDGVEKEILKSGIWFNSLAPDYWIRMSGPFTVTITSDIEPGDRLKVYYKGNYSDWQLLRPYDHYSISEIVVMALNTEEIQKSLNIQYLKPSRTLYFLSDLALTVSVEDGESQTVVEPADFSSGSTGSVSMATLEGGTYKVVFASGSVEYELTLILPDPPAEQAQTMAAEEMVLDLEEVHIR